jgi:hypothetical protein
VSVLLSLFILACSGGDDAKTPTPPVKVSGVPASLVAASWQVRFAKDEARAPFEGRASWVATFQGKKGEALAAFAAESDKAGLARAHAELAAGYRSAARAGGNAARIVYGELAQPSDPIEGAYLAGVGRALAADPAGVPGMEKASASANPVVKARVASWAKGGIPEDTAPKDVAAGTVPAAAPELWKAPLVGEPGEVTLGDPTDLVTLARWHEAAARAADPDSAAAIDALLTPYALPGERFAGAAAPLPDAWVFMSAYASAEDLLLHAAIVRDGAGAVDAFAEKSPYAAAIKGCMKDAALSVDCMVDASVALGRSIETAMEASAGKVDGFHRPFADFARAGVLRLAADHARALGDNEAMGRLYILALDKNMGAARDPVFVMQLAAWDVGNRNTPRATELLHELDSTFPALASARSVVDALHVRLSRNAAPGIPMN